MWGLGFRDFGCGGCEGLKGSAPGGFGLKVGDLCNSWRVWNLRFKTEGLGFRA